jgi:uncharacterized protein (TIGR01244 family)
MKRTTLVAAALAVVGTLAAGAQVRKAEMEGVSNFSRVDATVGCGGETKPNAMAALKQNGFASVINLRMATEPGAEIEASRSAAQKAGLKYIHLPFNAAAPDAKVVENFLAAVADQSNQPVYIHCASANRVGAVWMIKRALQDGWNVDKARQEAEAIGLTNERLKTFAADYIAAHRK